MTEKDAERQFEIEASTMDRQQIYDLAKRQALEIERLNIRFGTTMIELTKVRRELTEARAKLDEHKLEAKERSLRD